jgi:hypothetical protein
MPSYDPVSLNHHVETQREQEESNDQVNDHWSCVDVLRTSR